MKTVTLSQYQSIGPSWAQPDCEHVTGIWRRDLAFTGLHNRCVTECRLCGAKMRGKWTAWGRVTRIVSVEKGNKR